MFYNKFNNCSNAALAHKRDNINAELESLEKSLEFVPENSVLGYMSISAAIAFRKKELQIIEDIFSNRNVSKNNDTI